jgi:hypothetical protein
MDENTLRWQSRIDIAGPGRPQSSAYARPTARQGDNSERVRPAAAGKLSRQATNLIAGDLPSPRFGMAGMPATTVRSLQIASDKK